MIRVSIFVVAGGYSHEGYKKHSIRVPPAEPPRSALTGTLETKGGHIFALPGLKKHRLFEELTRSFCALAWKGIRVEVSQNSILHFFKDINQSVNQSKVDKGNGDKNLIKRKGSCGNYPGNPCNIHEGDNRQKRRCLQKKNHLIGISRPSYSKGRGHDYYPVKEEA